MPSRYYNIHNIIRLFSFSERHAAIANLINNKDVELVFIIVFSVLPGPTNQLSELYFIYSPLPPREKLIFGATAGFMYVEVHSRFSILHVITIFAIVVLCIFVVLQLRPGVKHFPQKYQYNVHYRNHGSNNDN